MQACGVALRCARQVSGAADVSHPSDAATRVGSFVPLFRGGTYSVPPRERDSFNVVTVGDSRKSQGEAGPAMGYCGGVYGFRWVWRSHYLLPDGCHRSVLETYRSARSC